MRPSRTVASAALTAALALGALPGLAGSHQPGPNRPVDAAAFRQVILASSFDRSGTSIATLDAALRSDGNLAPGARFSEGANRHVTFPSRSKAAGPAVSPSWSWKPPKSTVAGEASWYSYGTTAMRLPRGTVVVICGDGGCIERVINDYGPAASTGRVIDLYKPDFAQVCGCSASQGVTEVSVKIYGVP